MRPLHRLALGGIMTLMASGAMAAELGQHYDSYRDMHEKTQYGSLFFNEGAIRVEQSRVLKRFIAITGDGELNLPSQQGYCFVFNHYDSPNGNSVTHTYRAKISKWFNDGTQTDQLIPRTYKPASENWSSDLPDICVNGIRRVTKVAIAFSSDDEKYFDWNISFAVK
jgi:hypothetical protein